MRTDLSNRYIKKSPKAAGKRLKRVGIEALQICLEEFVSQRGVRVKVGQQSVFFKHCKGMDFEGKKPCSSQHISEAEARLLRDLGLTRGRWVQWFSGLPLATSPTLKSSVAEKEVWPPCPPLYDSPFIFQASKP